MNLLITGGYGQLGNELKRCLDTMTAEIGPIPSEYEGATYDAIDYDTLDISDAAAVDAWFAEHDYDIVVNCAAITNVDGCETSEGMAYKVNAVGPENLSRAAAAQNAKFVQISTDYVFPGNVEGERVETDEVGPISAYGRTKLAGEKLALAANEKTFVLRTAWLYGYIGKNFVKTMQKLGNTHDRITVVDDQLGNPTSANDLAYEILKVALTENYGVYHCTNEGTCSWCDFATQIMRLSGIICKVDPVTSEQYKEMNPASADRPHFSSLKNQRLADTVGNEMRPWMKALETFVKNQPELGN